jgi:hypothetical protein
VLIGLELRTLVLFLVLLDDEGVRALLLLVVTDSQLGCRNGLLGLGEPILERVEGVPQSGLSLLTLS